MELFHGGSFPPSPAAEGTNGATETSANISGRALRMNIDGTMPLWQEGVRG